MSSDAQLAPFPLLGKCALTPERAVSRLAASTMEEPDQPNLDFDDLVQQYYQPLFRFALSLSRKQEDAVDLTQQTFLVLVKKSHQVRDRSKIKSWLFTTLYREYLGQVRRSSRMNLVDIDTVTDDIVGPREDMIRKLDAQGIMEAFDKVPETFREPLILFYVDDLSYREIAATLDVPIGTVMSRLSRGKRELKRIMHQLDSPNKPSKN